jgi:lipopolysaccharide export system permease protein
MSRLQKYFFAQLLPTFGLTLVGLTLIAILTQSLTQLDLLIERGQSPWTFIIISLLSVPQVMSVVVPIALFVAVSATYARLHRDNEIVIAYSTGQSQGFVAKPALQLAAIAALTALAINVFVQPFALKEMRDRVFQIRSDLASTMVREGEFRVGAKGLVVYARKLSPNKQMNGLMVSDSRVPGRPVLFVAKTGSIVKVNKTSALAMRNGTIQRTLDNGKVDILGFDVFVLELTGFVNDDFDLVYKPSDRYMADLIKPDLTHYYDQAHVNDFLAEAHRRLAAPLLCFAAAVLAVLGVIGGAFSRQGYAKRIANASFWVVVVLLCFSGLIPTASLNPEFGYALYVVPLAVVFFAGRKLYGPTYKTVKMNPGSMRREAS